MSAYFGLLEAGFVLLLVVGFGAQQLLSLRALDRRRRQQASNDAGRASRAGGEED
ncbi:MAG: hypothetical protein JNL21_21660 [Myxococcales bacterium]|nr:hypothetical protein [Myxococcales bacterium]